MPAASAALVRDLAAYRRQARITAPRSGMARSAGTGLRQAEMAIW
jgi:hypothetical protein